MQFECQTRIRYTNQGLTRGVITPVTLYTMIIMITYKKAIQLNDLRLA